MKKHTVRVKFYGEYTIDVLAGSPEIAVDNVNQRISNGEDNTKDAIYKIESITIDK